MQLHKASKRGVNHGRRPVSEAPSQARRASFFPVGGARVCNAYLRSFRPPCYAWVSEGWIVVSKSGLLLSRRKLLVSGAATLILGGCDRLSSAPTFQQFLATAEGLTYRSQRTLIGRAARAREYSPKDISKALISSMLFIRKRSSPTR